MKISIITAFPDFVSNISDFSIIKRAINKKLLQIEIIDLKKYGIGKYHQIDDKPYGGGAGMIMMLEPLYNAIKEIRTKDSYTILTSASGKILNYRKSSKLSKIKHLIIICGHYEGIDSRAEELFIDENISIGNYVLSGGEIPSMVIIDSIVRLIPGVIKSESLIDETNNEYFEYPQYTRPEEYLGKKVPEVLLSGNHKLIENWKTKMKKKRKLKILI